MKTSNKAFIKMFRSPEARQLLEKRPRAFHLLQIIAMRLHWGSEPNSLGLKPGEAMVGRQDFLNAGWTEAHYRGAKKYLKNNGLATFKSNRNGTIAMLSSSTIFDPNLAKDSSPKWQAVTGKPPKTNRQITNNKEVKEKRSPLYSKNEFQDLLTEIRRNNNPDEPLS